MTLSHTVTVGERQKTHTKTQDQTTKHTKTGKQTLSHTVTVGERQNTHSKTKVKDINTLKQPAIYPNRRSASQVW